VGQATVPAISPEEEIGFMNIDRTDFASLSRAAQIRNLEVEGFVVFPGILTPELMGPAIVFTRGFFQRTKLGSPGISLHTDARRS